LQNTPRPSAIQPVPSRDRRPLAVIFFGARREATAAPLTMDTGAALETSAAAAALETIMDEYEISDPLAPLHGGVLSCVRITAGQ